MTTTDDLKLVASIQVGPSATYAVVSVRASSSMTSPSNQTRSSYEEIRWDLECLAEIASPTSITQLNQTIKSDLAKIGQVVTLTELGTARVMPAQGVGGSLHGYPRVELTDIPDKSFGQFQAFNLTAITRVPIADGSGIVEHTTETETITNTDGTIETSVRGEIRLANGDDASAWINTNIFTPVRSAADAAGNGVITRVSITDDTSMAKYAYTVKPGVSGSPGVTQANVDDRTVADVTGRRVRTISGSATGTGASTFATAQRVAEDSNLKLLREDGPSLPSIPDGRVNFSYQYVAGVTNAAFPGIFITRFNETIDEAGGGAQINTASFFSQGPTLRTGVIAPTVYTQRTEIEFIGPFANHGLTPQLATDNISGRPRQSRKAQGELKTVVMSWAYIFPAPLASYPNPRTINGLI
ncbi:hypothetical protein COB72_03480 [bacterium]|nr:MAG: hypothetical protein COB72_03480 [bacterium]